MNMASLYVASTETFVGKSAICVGLLERARRDGFRIGYLKPVSLSVTHTEDTAIDEDAAFVRQYFELAEPLDQLAPVLLTQGAIERIVRGQTADLAAKLREAYSAVARDKDLVVSEGTNHWSEGAVVGLASDQVADLIQAPVLLVTRYRSMLALDPIFAAQRFFGSRLIGVVINSIGEPQIDLVRTTIVPFLEQQGLPVFATLVQDQQLAGITVSDLHEQLGGELIGSRSWPDKTVEHLVIGAMGVEAALSFFRRRPHKAVFTGGDRSDLQLAALETSTALLILTGNIRPAAAVIDRAAERQVAILLASDDTLTTVERAEAIFGRVRFKQAAKIARITALLDQGFDFARLYGKLGLAAG
jgi:BioD-like phosphotransacetylase family protein